MTADDIIRANPTFQFQHAKIGHMDGLKGIDPDNGHEVWVIWHGNKHVVAEGPWNEVQIFMAQEQVLAASGRLQYASGQVH